MTVFVAFATVEGQTEKIASFVSDEIRAMGRDVSVLDVDQTASADFNGVKHVVLAASVHERRHPRSFEAFITASKEELKARRTMLLSVSLSAAFPEGMAEAEDYVVEMNMRTELSPDVTLLVAGAVQEGAYDYYSQQVLKQVVLKDREFDPEELSEHEFTDWEAIRSGLRAFLNGDS
ncbi:MAG: protoporphyrinogen oxidase [Boseongicola sp. SB0676_bin_33]|uniref:Protoporphyrinogen oxidase n=1 Tax=Boseongicola sp. SB0664_bin_43 TaxID=2604844 RepID=A0A6B0Y367_9RHOB|nr:protoporphyrinogen oxidase [Boseongicola sp. SB0664_bin_43]MYF88707.1 protoporphyrinogen oxidase [Boseongicola sp. SB0676_bin_33]MYK32304.1 protoporphyrinogen oxidase [Boseongicola sp. SB0670_bin_30]